ESGFVPRSAETIDALIKAAYGADSVPSRLQASLQPIADALNRGDLARATMLAVLSRTPELSHEAAAKLARAEQGLAKHNYNRNEPRDWHGDWTRGGASEGSSAARPPVNQPASGRPDVPASARGKEENAPPKRTSRESSSPKPTAPAAPTKP